MERGRAEWLLDYPRREIYPHPELRMEDFSAAGTGVRKKLRRVKVLNKLLLIQRFRKYVFEGNLFEGNERLRVMIQEALGPGYRLVDGFAFETDFVAVFRPVAVDRSRPSVTGCPCASSPTMIASVR
jgi:hypothetical protein